MRKIILSAAALALVAAPALAGQYNKKLEIGQKAPTFAGVAATCKGEETSVSLPDIKEPVVVLAFMANHCPAVVAYEDRVIDFAKMYESKGVKVVGIAVSGKATRSMDDLPAIKAREKEKNFTFAYGFDETMDIGRAYGATRTPTFIVLDKDRKVQYMGAMDDSMNESKVTKVYLKDAVDALLAGKTVPVAETNAVGCGIQYEKK